MTTSIKSRLVRALKGFLRTYKLQPFEAGGLYPDGEYHPTFKFFKSGDEMLQLQYQREAHDRVLRLLGEAYPDKVDRNTASRLLVELAVEWIEKEKDIKDDAEIRAVLSQFISDVEDGIKDYLVFVPIDGLELEDGKDLPLGRALLHKNGPNSHLNQVVESAKSSFGDDNRLLTVFENAPSFMTVKLSGHHQRAVETASEAAREALAVLRLYMGSYYSDIYRRSSVPLQMGIAGTLTQLDQSILFIKEAEVSGQKIPGGSFKTKHFEPFTLSPRGRSEIERLGLAKINQHLNASISAKKDAVARRLHRALNWFSKGTTALSIADSYLMYAIAIEALLSEGRTPQETYALWVAALATREGDFLIHPMGGYISTSFSERLKKASDISGRFQEIRSRMETLFSYRNDIAHGSVLDDEIEPTNLLDFETLIRSAVLSFAIDDWKSMNELKDWVAASTAVVFSPQPR